MVSSAEKRSRWRWRTQIERGMVRGGSFEVASEWSCRVHDHNCWVGGLTEVDAEMK